MSDVVYRYQLNDQELHFSKKLMCIEYPGLVNNVDKMVQTLGGMHNIGIVYSAKNRRVELRFRPEDLYCKPTCGDRSPTFSLLLKVKIKKQFRSPDTPCSSKDADNVKTITFTTSVIGIIDTIYRFGNLNDFQYLPMDFKKGDLPGGRLENIYERLRPTTVPTTHWLNEDNVPLFLTPPVFSRFDSVHFYNSQKIKDPHADSHIIGRTRKKRKGHTIFITSKEEMVPKKPKAESLKMLHVKFLNDGPYDRIKKLFDERPVWSKNALIFHTNYTKDQLKHLLPTVAYYFVTGPWRVMWVRYGFDPRLDPDSRVFQTFDYRMRTVGGLKNKIKAKRSYSNCLLPYKNSPACRPKVAIISRHTMAKAYQKAKETSEEEKHDENLYIFRPGYIPPFRQMFYQYCDVHVPEIQAMINRIPKPDPENMKCDYRTGWFPSEFDGRCREIVSNLVAAEIKRQMFDQQKQKKRQQEFENEAEENYDENYDDEYYEGQDYNEEYTGQEQENNIIRTEIEISDSSSNDSELDFILETDADSDVVVDTE